VVILFRCSLRLLGLPSGREKKSEHEAEHIFGVVLERKPTHAFLDFGNFDSRYFTCSPYVVPRKTPLYVF